MKHLFVAGICAIVIGVTLPHPLNAWSQELVDVAVTGTILIPESTILNSLENNVGGLYNKESIAKDIQRIYDIGFFSDIQVETRDTEEGIALTFLVKERPIISRIEFEGNVKLTDEKIEEVLTFPPSDVSDSFNLKFYPQKVKLDEENIKQLYYEQGYHNAQIHSEFIPDSDAPEEKVVLQYHIEEGKKASVRNVTFEGNIMFPNEELQKQMATRKKGFFSFITGTGKYEETTFETDLERIRYFYADNGYLDAKVTEYDLDFREDSNLFITINLDEGAVYTMNTIDITGNTIYSTEELQEVLNVAPGDPFSRSKIREDILAVSDLYAEKGYLTPISEDTEGKLLIDPKLRIDRELKQVDLTYSIREGVPHFLSRITIVGNGITRDKVIRREMLIQEGELLNSALLEKSQQTIFNLGLFEEVNIHLSESVEPDLVDLEVAVTERSTGSFNFGGGWSSLDNFVVSGGVSYANVFGLAHQINLTATLGNKSQLFDLRYTMPHFLDSQYLVGIDAYKTNREYTSWDSDSVGGGLRVGREIWRKIFATLKYEYKQDEIKNVDEDASSIIKEAEGESKTSSGWLRLSRSTINNVLLPTKGWRTNLTGEIAGGILQGENDFYKLGVDNNTYIPIYKDFAFRIKTEVGYVKEYGRNDNVPIFERYFAGGADTVRGYEDRSIGPKDENGEEIGGNLLTVMTGELIIPVRKDLRLVAFYDMGDVYGPDESFDISSFKKGIGVGIRFRVPLLGVFRLDWGYKLDRESGDDADEIHFGIGALF